jgi:uncharacterized membrane protein
MTIESSRTLGGVGAILMLIGTLPVLGSYSFGILGLVGLILVLVALYGFANIYKEKGIFNYSLYGLIAGIVGIVIASTVLIVSVLVNLKNFLLEIYPSWNGSWSSISSLSGMTPNTSNITLSNIGPFLAGIFTVLVILWVFLIVWAFFARRSLGMLSTKTGVGLFSTAALLLLIGAVLTIIIIGFLLMWIAVLLMAIAFFQIKAQPVPPPPMATTPPQMSTPM